MPKKLSSKTQIVSFSCTSCNKSFDLVSGHKEKTVNIDICSNCHPFYQGKLISNSNLGPAEKLKDKFLKGKQFNTKK